MEGGGDLAALISVHNLYHIFRTKIAQITLGSALYLRWLSGQGYAVSSEQFSMTGDQAELVYSYQEAAPQPVQLV